MRDHLNYFSYLTSSFPLNLFHYTILWKKFWKKLNKEYLNWQKLFFNRNTLNYVNLFFWMFFSMHSLRNPQQQKKFCTSLFQCQMRIILSWQESKFIYHFIIPFEALDNSSCCYQKTKSDSFIKSVIQESWSPNNLPK